MRLAIGFTVGVAIVAAGVVWARLRWLRRAALADAARIPALHYRYTGVDEWARRRSESRRAEADRKSRDARRVRTQDDASARIHRVV